VPHVRLPRARLGALIVLLAAGVLLFWVPTPPSAFAAVTAASWDTAQQRQVLAVGLMAESSGSFAGASRLSVAEANAAMVALAPMLQSALAAPAPTDEQSTRDE
jgi:4-amino-4-deoxy-L-arabinose transferase-like glycosyltransferase